MEADIGRKMARQKAIEYYKQLSNEVGIDIYIMLNIIVRGKVLEEILARKTDTTQGVEYGALIGLVKTFSITKADF